MHALETLQTPRCSASRHARARHQPLSSCPAYFVHTIPHLILEAPRFFVRPSKKKEREKRSSKGREEKDDRSRGGTPAVNPPRRPPRALDKRDRGKQCRTAGHRRDCLHQRVPGGSCGGRRGNRPPLCTPAARRQPDLILLDPSRSLSLMLLLRCDSTPAHHAPAARP